MEIVTDKRQLHKPCKPVKQGQDISEIVTNLLNELEERGALGLSANQLGYNHQVFVMRVNAGSPVCVVNPVITKERGTQLGPEQCHSLPEKVLSVKRPSRIVVKGLNQYFKPVKYRLSGFYARIACHEIDHLNGILIIDRGEEDNWKGIPQT